MPVERVKGSLLLPQLDNRPAVHMYGPDWKRPSQTDTSDLRDLACCLPVAGIYTPWNINVHDDRLQTTSETN